MLVKNEFIAFLGLALWIGIVAANGLSGLLLGKFFYVYDTHNYAAAKIAYGKDHTTITGKLARVYGAVTLLIMLGVVAVLIRIW